MAMTQEEYFASIANAAPASNIDLPDGEKIPTLKFSELNKPHQGVVVEAWMTTEKGFNGSPAPTRKDGSPKPLLIVTVKQKDESYGKIYFKGAMLFALGLALAEVEMKSLTLGSMVGAAWTSNKKMDSGFEAKQYTVKVAPPK